MEELVVYLNDHLAGSVGALELLDHAIATSEDAADKAFLKDLRNDIEADQEALKEVLRQVGGKESAIRKAGAWLLEKMSRVKMQGGKDDLGFLQGLEALSLGIWGKRALWRTLATVAADTPTLRSVDYSRLEERACEQFKRVEAK